MALDATKLKRQRVARGLSQVRLAELARVDQKAITSYENGRRQPHPATLLRLADALKVNAEAIMREE